MKKIILITLVLCTLVLAQEKKEEKQGIELPDFVITGLQSVSMPEMEKIKPPVVSTLSREFFNPEFSPEELTLGSISKPEIRHAEEEEIANPNNGKLRVGAGIYTLPEGLFHYGRSFGNFMFSAKIWGGNEKEHVDHSGYNYSGGMLNTDFFVSNNSPFIPGLRVGLNALYAREDYKFYGSLSPADKRKNEAMDFGVFLANHKDANIKFKAGANLDINSLPDEGNGETYSDVLLKGYGNLALTLRAFTVRGEANYIIQNLSGSFLNQEGNNFFSAKSLLYYRPSINFSLSAGAFFAGMAGNSVIGPVINLKLKVNKEISLLGAWSTSADFYTLKDFISVNHYIELGATPANVFEKTSGNLKFALDYEYNKFFEVIAGFEFSVKDNHFYYTDTDNNGKFEVLTIDDYKSSLLFLQTNFHLGPFGIFYGELNYFMYDLAGIDRLPYEPDIKFSGVYGYEFFPGLEGTIGFDFTGAVYTNSAASKELDPVVQLSAGAKYEYFKNLAFYADLENLLGRKDESWYHYREKPFDISAGVEYRW